MRFLLLGALIVLCAAQSTWAFGFGYQLHSANDLREWHQWFRKVPSPVKGFERMLKIDPHYVSDTKICAASGVSDPRGCLLLSHDNPTLTSDSPYNTTDQVLAFVEQHAYMFSEERPLSIALCFKDWAKPCEDSPSARNWLSLVDDLFEKAEDLRHVKGINVEFTLDGDGIPSLEKPCLKDKWRPWNSTWINSPMMALESNNVADGYDRFQILDDPDVSLEWFLLAQVGFGKFGHGRYPILVWEPSDQDRFTALSRLYLGSHNHNAPPLTFAINVDIAMFQLYMAEHIPNATHAVLPHEAGADIPLAARVSGERVIVMSRDATGQSVSAAIGNVGDLASITPSLLVGISWIPTSLSAVELNSVTSVVMGVSSNVPDDENAIVFVANNASWATFTTTESALSLRYSGELEGVESDVTVVSTTAVMVDEKTVARVMVLDDAARQIKHVLHVQLLEYSETAENHASLTPISAPASTNIVVVDTQQINAAAFMSQQGVCAQDQTHIVVSYSSGSDVSLAIICANLTSGAIEVMGAGMIDVGSSSSLSLMETTDGLALLEAHTNGYCDNSHSHNTRATPRVCSAPRSCLPRVLAYNYGLISDWISHLLMTPGYVTSCHERLIHGAFDQGSSPTAVLIQPHPHSLPRAVVAHRGVADVSASSQGARPGVLAWSPHHKSAEVDESGCGMPQKFDGIVLDAWELPLDLAAF